MITTVNDSNFVKEMNNILQYAEGFLDGIKIGKPLFLAQLGKELKIAVEAYIDSSATVQPARLQHVYEWQSSGSPDARLFDVSYVVAGRGLVFNANFTQSTSIQQGSNEAFYDKARIMEDGIPVTIRPKNSSVLAFDVDGKTVFTRKEITIEQPGGPEAAGGFRQTFEQFFSQYLSQSMLDITGVSQTLRNPIDFKVNLRAGASGGRSVGVSVGTKWITRSAR